MALRVPNSYDQIRARLTAVRKKENVGEAMYGALLSTWIITSVLIIAVIIGAIFPLDILPRTIVFWSIAVLATAMIAWGVIRPMLRLIDILPNESDCETARKVGNKFPQVSDRLMNVLQLYGARERLQYYSVDFVDAAFDDVWAVVDPLDFGSAVDSGSSRRMGSVLGATFVVAALLYAALPSSLLESATRLYHYDRSFAVAPAFRFVVDPGNKEVVKGETVPVVVRLDGNPQQRITVSSKPEGQVAFDDRILEADPSGVFRHEFRSVKATTHYYLSAGPIRSDEFTLTVIDRPAVKMLRLALTFPPYTRLSPRQLDDNLGDVTAVKGTRIAFSVEANKEIVEAALVLNDSSLIALGVTGATAAGSITLVKDRTYHIRLKDNQGLSSIDPIEYTLKVVPDAYPTATIVVPGMNIDIAGNDQLNMLFKITDDYGFSSSRLAYRLTQSRYERPAEDFTFAEVPLADRNGMEEQISYRWSLTSLSLVPEDVVSYYLEVFDNDNVSGPKSAKSEMYTLRLPSLDEVFADVNESHETSLEGIKEALEQAQEARQDLEKLQQEMKKNLQKADWQEKKKAEELGKKYEEIQKKIDETRKAVDQMVSEMLKNQVLSQETLQKYQELQQLMEQMNSSEFADAMKKMQQAFQQISPEAMRQALQQFSFSEENFRKSIERTLNLLKRIQIEQKVDEVIRRTEELMRQQEELHAQAQQTNPQDRSKQGELAEEQKDLRDQLEKLQKEMSDLQKKMEEFPAEMPLAEMERAMNQLEESQLRNLMDQIAQRMQSQQMDQALEKQGMAMQKMGNLLQQLQQMRQALRQNQQRQIVNEMRKALQDMLEISKRQEQLKKESQALEQNSQRFREAAQDQMDAMRDLANVTNGLSKLSQRTFSISPEMGKSIGDAMRQMHQAIQSLEQRSGSAAAGLQAGAMSSLNEVAQQLQSAMNSMMQGNSQGMGMAGLMQRLQRLSSMQQGINMGTQNLGGMSPQQAAELARLAGEQGMVRKSLEQLAKEAANAGELSKILGDLNRLAQDMREVQTDLAQGNVNPETLRKQERILSRLLDSQRSVRERDFEKTRKAESGKEKARNNPPEIDLTTQEGRNRIRQDLLKALEEGYSKDYQELIRRYFEALEQLDRGREF